MWLQSHLAARLSHLICWGVICNHANKEKAPSLFPLLPSLSHLFSSWLQLNCKTSGSSLIINFHSRVPASVLV